MTFHFGNQNVPSTTRVAADAFGFLTLIQVLDGPERYGAFSFFETIPSRPSLQNRSNAAPLLDFANLFAKSQSS
jgi:hypothetical protein